VPTVTLTFTALPEHVRTARLVAAAVGRRLGLTEDVLDGVRLAVGEACARAVGRVRTAGLDGSVEVQISERPDRLVVVVRDEAGHLAEGSGGSKPEEVSLTVVRALADEVEIDSIDNDRIEPDGAHAASADTLRLVWHI